MTSNYIGSASLLLCLVTFALARNIALLNGNEADIVTSKASEFVAPCTVTQFQDIPSATKSCTDITIQDVTVPGAETLDLSKLKKGTKITFAGTTSFEFAEENVDLIQIGGTDITVEGAPGHVLDGNGQAWWDGIGSNGGMEKPNHFMALKKVVGKSVVRNLLIQSWPVHCFYISGAQGLLMENIILNNSLGDAPNERSEGKSAGHNSDGFGLASSDNVVIRNSKVWNQDDCVAITSGNNITVYNLYCHGGHGLSIGSVGGKSNNTVTNITFRDSVLDNQENGIRIKTNAETTGIVRGITFENIRINNATKYGLVIQQDYLNGGPNGRPTNGVKISDINIRNVTGTSQTRGKNAYILCGQGSCTNFSLNDVKITGGTNGDYCNNEWKGNFQCPKVKPAKL